MGFSPRVQGMPSRWPCSGGPIRQRSPHEQSTPLLASGLLPINFLTEDLINHILRVAIMAGSGDEEDDYMNMSFADPEPSLPSTSLQRQQLKRKRAEIKGRPKSKAELQKEAELAREAALSKSSLDPKSKGAQMMAKMGFKGGALGKSKDARTEPIELTMKEGRGGIGMDNEKKRKIREVLEAMEGKEKRQKADEGDYRERVAREREERRHEGLMWGAMKVAEKFDTEEQTENGENKTSAATSPSKVNILWRNLAVQRVTRDRERMQRKGALESLSSRYQDPEADADDKVAMGTEVEEVEEEDPELDEFNALDPQERLSRIVDYLRKTYNYCFWCKYKYPDAEMEGCPGVTEEEHD